MNDNAWLFQPYTIEAMFREFRKYDHFNFIDVGCYEGGYYCIGEFLAGGVPMFSIGIDPIKQTMACNPSLTQEPKLDLYSVFLQKAISMEHGIKKFYRYNSGETNGSLKKMISSGITFDKSEKNKFWTNDEFYHYETVENFTRIKEIVEVECVTLKSVYDEYISNRNSGLIHFLKIDAQGVDNEVFLSLGEDIIRNKCLFVQLECTMSKFKTAQVYEGASIFFDDLKMMEDFGYGVLNVKSHDATSIEADVVFVNRNLVK